MLQPLLEKERREGREEAWRRVEKVETKENRKLNPRNHRTRIPERWKKIEAGGSNQTGRELQNYRTGDRRTE